MLTLEIQPSFTEVLRDISEGTIPEDQFWLNLYETQEKLENGVATEEIIKVTRATEGLLFHNDNISFKVISSHRYELRYKDQIFPIIIPKNQIESAQNKIITTLDVNTQQTNIAQGTTEGDIIITTTHNKESKLIPNAHFNSITNLKFFPSGQVLLSTGLDYQIKIWDIDVNPENASAARVFQGHTKQITDLDMIERGRNFLSASEDGTVKLWDCATGSCLTTLKRKDNVRDGVTALAVMSHKSRNEHIMVSEDEFGTEDKYVFAGHESGVITLFDLTNKSEITNFASLGAPVTKILTNGDNEVLVGYSNGIVAKWDISKTGKPLKAIKFNGEINAISKRDNGEAVVSYGTGFVVQTSFESSNEETVTIYGGIDSDVKTITSVDMNVYASNNSGDLYAF